MPLSFIPQIIVDRLTDVTPEEAIGKIKETLKQMTEEGEI